MYLVVVFSVWAGCTTLLEAQLLLAIRTVSLLGYGSGVVRAEAANPRR